MAYGTLRFVNLTSGETKSVPVGFSWTTLFFGVFVPLFRMDWKNLAIQFIVYFVTGVISAGLLAFIPLIVFAFIYNKMHVKNLLKKGWKIDGYEGIKTFEQVADDVGMDLSRFKK